MDIKNGEIEDLRSLQSQNLDYKHDEFLGLGIPNWIEKTQDQWSKLSIRFQSTSGSCGGQSGAKGMEYIVKQIASASPIYKERTNYPAEGMWIQQIGDILKNQGTCLESECTSENMTEEQMDDVKIPDILEFKVSGYYMLPFGSDINMDLLAEALDAGNPIIILIRSNSQEYISVPISNGQPTTFGHFVCSIPSNYTLYNGEKSVIIDDSCAPGSTINEKGQRIFTESFLKARSFGIMALIPLQTSTMPVYEFNTDLSLGMTSQDVGALQKVLQALGLFPSSQTTTDYFGPITKKAVMAFQQKYSDTVLLPAGLSEPTGFVGSFTRMQLNALTGRN